MGCKPASQKQARWVRVGCVLTGCLWLIEEKILGIFLENGRGCCVDISTIFKNPDILLLGQNVLGGPPVSLL